MYSPGVVVSAAAGVALLSPLTVIDSCVSAPFTGLPKASRTVIDISVGSPATPFGTLADVFEARASAAVTSKVAELTSVNPDALAENVIVYPVPAVSVIRLSNAAVPSLPVVADVILPEVKAAPFNVTDIPIPSIGLPWSSVISTAGAGVTATPAVVSAGCWIITICDG